MSTIVIFSNFGMGLVRFRKELLLRLIKDGFRVIAAYPKDAYVDEIESFGCEFVDVPMNRRGMNPVEDFVLIREYKKILKKYKPDIVLTYTIKPNIYGPVAAQKFKIPVIVNITGLGSAIQSDSVFSKVLLKLYRVSLKHAKFVFFQNKNNLEVFMENRVINKKNRYMVLPGSGVNVSNFPMRFVKNTPRITLLFIGRLMKDKGIEELLEASKLLINKYENIDFKFIGFSDDWDERKILEFTKDDRIVYLGEQEDVRPFISEASAIIHPSYHEGLSNVLLEGAAMGRPLLASNIPGCNEIIDDGVNGFLFEPRSSDAIVQAVEKFMALSFEERQQMGRKSREKVEREFDRQIVVDAYMEEIERLLGDN